MRVEEARIDAQLREGWGGWVEERGMDNCISEGGSKGPTQVLNAGAGNGDGTAW